MKKNSTIAIVVFLFINWIVMISSNATGIERIFLGVSGRDFKTGELIFFFLLLSLCSALVFIYIIANVIDNIFIMSNYIVVRSNRRFFIKQSFVQIYKYIGVLSCVKIICDLWISYPLEIEELIQLLIIFVLSYILSFATWSNIMVMLITLGLKKSIIYFITIIAIFLLQIFPGNTYISIFSILTSHFFENTGLSIFIKVLIWASTLAINIRLLSKMEFLGEVTE